MAEKDRVVKEELKHKGIFDFAALYSFSHSWWKEEYGINESKYTERVSGNKRDIRIEWIATKDISDYFKFEHKIEFIISGLTDVEVEIDGEKKKMNQGEIEIKITAILVKDKDSKWDTSPFNRFMRDVYNKYVIPSRIEDIKIQLSDDAREFKDEIKAFLELTASTTFSNASFSDTP